jgi:hypothetical protein
MKRQVRPLPKSSNYCDFGFIDPAAKIVIVSSQTV